MLVPCPSCRRHVRAASATCPFCDRAAPSIDPRRAIASTLVMGAVIAGCGGEPAPPPPPLPVATTTTPAPSPPPTTVTVAPIAPVEPTLPEGVLPPPDPDPTTEVPAEPSGTTTARRAGRERQETPEERAAREAEEQLRVLGPLLSLTPEQQEAAIRAAQGTTITGEEMLRQANAYGGPPLGPSPRTGGNIE